MHGTDCSVVPITSLSRVIVSKSADVDFRPIVLCITSSVRRVVSFTNTSAVVSVSFCVVDVTIHFHWSQVGSVIRPTVLDLSIYVVCHVVS